MVMLLQKTSTTVDALKSWSGDGSCGKTFPHLCDVRFLTSPSFRDCEIRNLHLILQCYSINREDIKLAEKLSEEADVLLESLRTDPAPGDNAESGFKLSFYDFCRGSAYACKAFFHSDLARRGSSVEQNFRLAEEYYLQAAEAYPVDDEHHCKYLNSALKNLFYRPGVTVRRALDIMARFWVSVKEPKKIWNQHPSRMRPERDQSNGIVMYRENVLRREGSLGRCPLDTKVTKEIQRSCLLIIISRSSDHRNGSEVSQGYSRFYGNSKDRGAASHCCNTTPWFDLK